MKKDSKKTTKKYYGKSGKYLEEHRDFFKTADINADILFLIKALKIKKTDVVLDIACGQGRHVNALNAKGFNVDGCDFSESLLTKARKAAPNDKVKYYIADVENFKLNKLYDKAYWFFSDLAGINLSKATSSISKNLKAGGLLLIDTDNVFRIACRLAENNDKDFYFDAEKLLLHDKKSGITVPYPTLPMWQEWLKSNKLSLISAWGDYKFNKYSIRSPRLIILAKKVPGR